MIENRNILMVDNNLKIKNRVSGYLSLNLARAPNTLYISIIC
jgi:hypothetical protein